MRKIYKGIQFDHLKKKTHKLGFFQVFSILTSFQNCKNGVSCAFLEISKKIKKHRNEIQIAVSDSITQRTLQKMPHIDRNYSDFYIQIS